MTLSLRLFALLTLALVGLWGCDSSSGTVAGGEDFPNTVQADVGGLDSATREALDSAQGWDALAGSARGLPSLAVVGQGASSILAGRQALLLQDTMLIDFSDTSVARGATVRVIVIKSLDSLWQTDTVAVVWNAQARDLARGNEWIRWSVSRKENRRTGVVTVLRVTPVAPDTLVSAVAGRIPRLHLRETRQGVLQFTAMDMEFDAGADGSSDTESDNRIFWAQFLRVNGAETSRDTVSWDQWRDGDGDSVALNRTTGAKGVVQTRHVERTPAGQPRVRRLEENSRLLVNPKDTANSEPLRYHRQEEWISGRRVELAFYRATGDSDLVAGQDARVLRLAVLGSDTVQSDFVVSLDSSLKRADRHRLVQTHSRVRKANGRLLDLRFTPTVPLLPGESHENGAVELVFAPSSTVRWELAGNLVKNALTAHVRNSQGLSGTATWNSQGQLVRWVAD